MSRRLRQSVPTPLLTIVGRKGTITPTGITLVAHERALESDWSRRYLS
ncbi:hypothetical protein [Streptomyces sp. NPDC048521]